MYLNQTVVNKIGWKNPIGKMIGFTGFRKKCNVIGVVKDFNLKSLHFKIQPLFIQLSDTQDYISIKISEEDYFNTIHFIEEKWKSFNTDIICEHFFLNDKFNMQYKSEQKWSKIFKYFSLFTITIACLGLLGIVSYIVEQRTKEIGIRKVLGASAMNILKLILANFVKLILFSSILGLPIAWYVMNRWLQNFAFRIELDWWIFLSASCIVLLIALLTISWQVIRAAQTNPVDSLRYE